jgi:16S rRNA (cytidine1402-2'-O)-methyltransferase
LSWSSAGLAALTASGLPAESFQFRGFLPARRTQRRKALEQLRDTSVTLILYEAPHRILETLSEMAQVLGDRPIVAARELTKLHEEFLRGSAAEIREALASRPSVKGEFTLVIGGCQGAVESEATPEDARGQVERLIDQGAPRMEAIKAVARRLGLPKREVYRALED